MIGVLMGLGLIVFIAGGNLLIGWWLRCREAKGLLIRHVPSGERR